MEPQKLNTYKGRIELVVVSIKLGFLETAAGVAAAATSDRSFFIPTAAAPDPDPAPHCFLFSRTWIE